MDDEQRDQTTSGEGTKSPPQGIDQQLDAGVADDAHQGDEADTDLQPADSARTDPDDPEAGMQASAKKARPSRS